MSLAIVTLIVLMLGGGVGFSFDMYRKAAGDVIQDKQIVKQIKSVTKAADKEMKNWQKDANKIAKQIVEMNQNYDLARTDVEPFLNQVDSRRNEFQEKLIQLRFQARDLMTQAQQAGRVAGKSELTIAFTGLMINNQIKPIRTSEIKAVAESGQGKNTVGKTARGAAIGGLIDGKDGAKTGAKVGVGASLLTKGGKINIPANTLLEVRLAEPFTP